MDQGKINRTRTRTRARTHTHTLRMRARTHTPRFDHKGKLIKSEPSGTLEAPQRKEPPGGAPAEPKVCFMFVWERGLNREG